MKKILSILLTLAMVFTLAACSTDGESKEQTTEKAKEAVSASAEGSASPEGKVGFSISTLNNPFFVSMADGAKSKAEELGVDLTVVDAGNDPAKQTTDIEDLVSKNIKVLIVNPVDSASVAPTIKDAMAAGIKVIAVDRSVEGVDIDTYIGTDNVIAGEKAGEELLKHVKEGDKIAILEGIPGASSAIERDKGFHNAIDGKLDVVASQTANYDRAEGLSVTENILQAHPDIVAILSANDEMALGAIEAAQASGKNILVTGFDATEDARAAVKDGKLLFTVEQQTVAMGEEAVQSALDYLTGKEVPNTIPIEVIMITK